MNFVSLIELHISWQHKYLVASQFARVFELKC